MATPHPIPDGVTGNRLPANTGFIRPGAGLYCFYAYLIDCCPDRRHIRCVNAVAGCLKPALGQTLTSVKASVTGSALLRAARVPSRGQTHLKVCNKQANGSTNGSINVGNVGVGVRNTSNQRPIAQPKGETFKTSGRTVVITGGSQGSGRATALLFAKKG